MKFPKFLLKKWVKVTLIVIASILLLLILINIIAPPILKNYIEKNSKDLCGRTVTLEKIKLNIFTGDVKVIDLKMLEADDKANFVNFDTLAVDVSIFRLLFNELRFNEITLVRPQISIWQEGENFNFDDIINHFSSDEPETPEADTTDEGGMALDLRKIKIKNGTIVYRDLERESLIDMRDFSLDIPRLYFSGESSDIGVEFKFADGGDISVKMKYDLENEKYNVAVKLNNFSIDIAKPYIKDYLNIDTFDGSLSADISVDGDLEHVTEIVAKGKINIDNLLATADNKDVIAVNNFNVDIDEVDVKNNSYLFNEISADGLKVIYEIFKNSDTFSKLLVEEEETEEPEIQSDSLATDSVVPMKFIIRKFAMKNSAVNYVDYTLKQTFRLPISNINVSSKNISFDSIFSIDVKALLGNAGELTAKWEGSLDDMKNQIINIDVRNFKLPEVSPYCVHYTAYPLSAGVLNFTSTNSISNNYIKSDNNLDIYNCKADKKIKNMDPEYKIPLKAGLYILTDRKGRILMDLPIQGDINSPDFSYKKLLFKTLTNLLIKVVATPADFIISSIGGDKKVLDDMEFRLSETSINSQHYDQLNGISDILKEKPGIILNIRQSINHEDNFEYYANKLNVTDTAFINQTIDVAIQERNDMIKQYFAIQNIPENHVKILPLGDKKPSKNKAVFSFEIVIPEDFE